MVTNNSDEWYTPPEVFETMNLRFDIDVSAPAGGIPWIPADRHYSVNDNALEQPWHGRVWMNPPYSNPGPFVRKWIEHGNGIALVPLSKSRWFGELWASNAHLVVPSNPALKFIRDNERKQIFMPICYASIGPQDNHDAIARLGRIRP